MVSINDLKRKLEEIEIHKKDIELYEEKINGAFETIELGMSMTKQMIVAQNNRIGSLNAMIKKFIEQQERELPNGNKVLVKRFHALSDEKITDDNMTTI